jgi:hypothetical protein
MPILPGNPTPPAGFLWRAGWSVETFGIRLQNLGDAIDDVFIIGSHLSFPFKSMASYAKACGRRLYEADDEYQVVKEWVRSIVDGNGFLTLLFWASSNFRDIKENAPLWFLNKLKNTAAHFPLLVTNPFSFVKRYVRQISYWLNRLIDSEINFINDLLRQLRGWIGYLLDNPVGWLRDNVRHISWPVRLLIDNPFELIRHFVGALPGDFALLMNNRRQWVLAVLFALSYDLGLFAQSPETFLKNRIATYLRLPQYFWSDPIFHIANWVIYYALIRFAAYKHRLKDLVVKIILEYI